MGLFDQDLKKLEERVLGLQDKYSQAQDRRKAHSRDMLPFRDRLEQFRTRCWQALYPEWQSSSLNGHSLSAISPKDYAVLDRLNRELWPLEQERIRLKELERWAKKELDFVEWELKQVAKRASRKRPPSPQGNLVF